MPTLYLTRHAKATRDPSFRDFDRPLHPRGISDAEKMARAFADRSEAIDLMVSSPAARAWATAEAFARALDIRTVDIAREPGIYNAETDALLAIVRALPPDKDRVMLFGHNPGFSMLAVEFGAVLSSELSTCCTVRIDLTGAWADAAYGRGRLVWRDEPAMHGA